MRQNAVHLSSWQIGKLKLKCIWQIINQSHIAFSEKIKSIVCMFDSTFREDKIDSRGVKLILKSLVFLE
jgi:hypothetical protein